MFEGQTEIQEVNLKLVQEIEKHPELYDNSQKFQKKKVIDKAWKEVADALNMSDSDCRYRWQNIKTVFKRKVRCNKDGIIKMPNYLDNAMEFYLPFVDLNPRFRANSIKIKTKPQKITVTPLLPTEIIVEDLGNYDNNCFSKPIPFGNKNPRNVMNPDHQYVTDPLLPDKEKLQMNEAESSSQRINRQRSAKMFLLSLMPEIEELSDHQIKLFKRRVLSAIDEVSNCYEEV